jgi:hypothetical protein
MIHGLFWTSLLIVFIGLAWAGWHEYHKVEGYKVWAQKFQRAKYDIYAVLGQNGDDLTWGKPTRKGIADLQTLSLQAVNAVQLIVDGQAIVDQPLPDKGKAIALEFTLVDRTVQIPFTEVALASQWATVFQQEIAEKNADHPTPRP